MTEMKQDKDRLEFESELADKEQMVDEEITILSVDEERSGSMGGKYRVAHIKYGDDEMDIALGSILSKQWAEWERLKKDQGHPEEILPAKAMITKEKGKRYYAFKYIQK